MQNSIFANKSFVAVLCCGQRKHMDICTCSKNIILYVFQPLNTLETF